MYYTEEPQKKIAGMLSMHVDTMVPKLARSYQDVACQMNERKVCMCVDCLQNEFELVISII